MFIQVWLWDIYISISCLPGTWLKASQLLRPLPSSRYPPSTYHMKTRTEKPKMKTNYYSKSKKEKKERAIADAWYEDIAVPKRKLSGNWDLLTSWLSMSKSLPSELAERSRCTTKKNNHGSWIMVLTGILLIQHNTKIL